MSELFWIYNGKVGGNMMSQFQLPSFNWLDTGGIQIVLKKVMTKQACCAGSRRRPFPMQLQQQAKSPPPAKLL